SIPSRKTSETRERNADRFSKLSCINSELRNEWSIVDIATCQPLLSKIFLSSKQSTISKILSPIATPIRASSIEFVLLKTQKGKFWIGKSVSGAFADSIQLLRFGS